MVRTHGPSQPFEGEVVRRDKDDFGLIQFKSPGGTDVCLGVFNHEVVYTPEVSRICKVGSTVHGFAVVHGDNFKIVHISPRKRA